MLDAVGVGDPAQDRDLGVGPAVGPQRRQAGHHVEEPMGQAGEGRPAAAPVRRRHPPDQHHEHRDQRHGQGDRQGRDEVHREQADDHDDGDDRRQRQLRQVPAEVAVERVEAARREQHDLAAARLRRPSAGRAPRRARGAAAAGPT